MLPSSTQASRLLFAHAALIFTAFYCLALLKNHDLLLFAAPYFEDKYFAALPMSLSSVSVVANALRLRNAA